MKSGLLSVICILSFCIRASAQSQHISYQSWVEKAREATGKGLHLEAAWAYGRAFGSGPGGDDPWTDRYAAAVSWMKALKPDSAMAQLNYLARHTGYRDYAEVELDPTFVPLQSHKLWKPSLAQIRRNRYRADPATDTLLSERLARTFVMDQRFRVALNPYVERADSQSPVAKALLDSMRTHDSINVVFVDSLLRTSGWQTTKQIGRFGVATVFLVVQHADSAIQATYEPMLRKATDDSELLKSDFAMFEDRLRLRQGNDQLYGTQLECSNGGCRVDRLADPLHVDERRKAVGLEPMAEYLKYWNLSWDPEAYERSRNAERAK